MAAAGISFLIVILERPKFSSQCETVEELLPICATAVEVLSPTEQARIVRVLVERVVIRPAGADIRLRLERLGGLVRNLSAVAPAALRAAA